MTNKVLQGNSIDVLKTLPDESVDCIITSPPYYQLRKYGDDEDEIGQEITPQEYIANLVEVFSECKRVLKADGTCFVNISDTYNGDKRGITDDKYSQETKETNAFLEKKALKTIAQKSLLGVPSRFEIAMIDSGWTLRNEIIWHKPNAMPSSITDRFTVDFEKIFFFVKSRTYYFKQLKEPMLTDDFTPPRGSNGVLGQPNSGRRKQDEIGRSDYTGFNDRYEPPKDGLRNKRCVWSINTSPSEIEHYAMFPESLVENMIECGCKRGGVVLDPFAGAGTTLKVAKRNNYQYIGIELYEKNCKIIEKRLARTPIEYKLELWDGEE